MNIEETSRDPFTEYIEQEAPKKKELSYAWYTAIGLQNVDGLSTSDYLKKLAVDNIEGRLSLSEANRLIESYYEEEGNNSNADQKEADIVSSRIAQILSEKAFSFSVSQYLTIHKRLFSNVLLHAGKLRRFNITKKEWVLDGDSVTYGNYFELQALLEYDFNAEANFSYAVIKDDRDLISHLSSFLSNLWQIHAFEEGNTRTTAVFFIKYLQSLGFDITNKMFAENAWYFRNALVRANYNNIYKGVFQTKEYLEKFLENLLFGTNHELKNRVMHIRHKKQDIDDEKQDIRERKPDYKYSLCINSLCSFTQKTRLHIEKLHKEYGADTVFGRKEVMELLSLTASPASELIKKMLSKDLLDPVIGSGKGKYRFRNQALK